jgi:hypothetical protein
MDTVWRDEEYGTAPYDPDTVGRGDLRSRGIESPTLEQQRRNGAPPSEWDNRGAPPPTPETGPLRRRGSRSMEGDPRAVDPSRPPPPSEPPVLGSPVDSARRDTSGA